jgi:hypothetical protein
LASNMSPSFRQSFAGSVECQHTLNPRNYTNTKSQAAVQADGNFNSLHPVACL